MEKREGSLLSNPAFLFAVYLDKRYNVLTEEQKELSQIHLLGLWKKIQIISATLSVAVTDSVSAKEDSFTNDGCHMTLAVTAPYVKSLTHSQMMVVMEKLTLTP